MGYIFVTKLSYLAKPEYQITARAGSWSEQDEVYSTLQEAVEEGFVKHNVDLGPETKIKVTDITDFDVNDNEVVKYTYTTLGDLIKT